MPLFPIESLDDPRLDPYRNLKRTNLTRWSDCFIAEGIRLVQRLLESDFPVRSILTSESFLHRLPPQALDRCDVYVAALPLLELIVGYKFHAGMLACGVRKTPLPLEGWLPPIDQPALLVGCPHTSDPDNLGTIIRVAAAFGADGLLVGSASADPFSRRALRLSMGNAFYLPVQETSQFITDLQRLRFEFGFRAIGSVLHADAQPLAGAQRPHRMILLLGNESDGLSPDLIHCVDEKIMIPMADRIDSLNVGIAAGIMLHHYVHVVS
jgi:tRNA G18 (ribose-2'-O)-methylase SpoU